MSKSHKNQHYVPMFYFRQFTAGMKSISVLLKKTGEVRKNAGISTQCSEKYFFGNAELEQIYSNIEGKIASLFSFIIANKTIPIDADSKLLLMIAASFQFNRTLKQRFRLAEKTRLSVKASLDAIVKGKREPRLTEEIAKFIEVETYDKNIHMDLLGEFILGGSVLIDLDVVLLINDTARDFIFCDAPCVFFNQAFSHVKGWGNIGYLSKGLQIFYPISRRITLLIFDKNYYTMADVKKVVRINRKDDVSKLNALQLHNAYKTAYIATCDMIDYVRSLWINESKRFHELPVFQEFPCYNQDGSFKGKYLLYSERAFDYPLNLSFIKTRRERVPAVFNPINYVRDLNLGKRYNSAMGILRHNAQRGHRGLPMNRLLDPVEHELFIRTLNLLTA